LHKSTHGSDADVDRSPIQMFFRVTAPIKVLQAIAEAVTYYLHNAMLEKEKRQEKSDLT